MGFPKGSYPIEDPFSSLASWTPYINLLDQKQPLPQPIILKLMVKPSAINQEVEHYLRTYTNNEQDDWSEWLSRAEYAHNNTEFILPPDTPLSSLIPENIHVHYPNLLNRLM